MYCNNRANWQCQYYYASITTKKKFKSPLKKPAVALDIRNVPEGCICQSAADRTVGSTPVGGKVIPDSKALLACT